MAEGVRVAPRGAGVGAVDEKTLLLLCGPVADEQVEAGEAEDGPERGALVYGDADGDRSGRTRPYCPWQPGSGGRGQLGVPGAELADREGTAVGDAHFEAVRSGVRCTALAVRGGGVGGSRCGARQGAVGEGRGAMRAMVAVVTAARGRERGRERRRCVREVGSTGAEACGVRRRRVVGRALVGAAGRVRGRGSAGPVPVVSRDAPERTAPSTGRWPKEVGGGPGDGPGALGWRSGRGGAAALCRGRLASVPAHRSGVRWAGVCQLWGASLRMQVRRALHTRLPSSSVMTIS